MITETDDIAEALDAAQLAWPHARDSRSRLIHLLIEEGYLSVSERAAKQRQTRLAAINTHAGALTGMYEPGYLEGLREEWPT